MNAADVAAQGSETPLVLAEGPPTSSGAYNIAGATAVLVGGMLDGWKIVGFGTHVASMNDVSGSYCEIIGSGTTNTRYPSASNDYMTGGIWLGYPIGAGDFDFSAKIAYTNAAGSGNGSANTSLSLGVGRVIGSVPTDSPCVAVRRFTSTGVRLGAGAMGSTGRWNLFTATPFADTHSARWLRLTRTGARIRAYYKLNEGDAWTAITSGDTDYDLVGAGYIMFPLQLGVASERWRIYDYSFAGVAP